MQIERLDHLVLTVRDIAATCGFYGRVLGMEVVTFDQERTALAFGQQKINLHQVGKEFEPKAAHPTTGSADLCFVTTLAIDEVLAHLYACGITIIEGPVARTGALGLMISVYLRDPDDNLIEIARYEQEP
jgi:catechol 2,3-dioxygenase-like lactoylglutathione lyase family enzyme